ncbi:MAG: hypothetical protein ACRD4X_13390 [Candidatus Acidiferrales bacterium]
MRSDGAHRYSVFVTPAGKRAVVIVNEERDKSIAAELSLPNHGPLIVASPEQPQARSTSEKIGAPPRSAVVVMEA